MKKLSEVAMKNSRKLLLASLACGAFLINPNAASALTVDDVRTVDSVLDDSLSVLSGGDLTVSNSVDVDNSLYVSTGGILSVIKDATAGTEVNNYGTMSVIGNVVANTYSVYNGGTKMTVGGDVTANTYVSNTLYGIMEVGGNVSAGTSITNSGVMEIGGSLTAETNIENRYDYSNSYAPTMNVRGDVTSTNSYISNTAVMNVGHVADPTVEGDTTVVSSLKAKSYITNNGQMSVTGDIISEDSYIYSGGGYGSPPSMTAGGSIKAATYVWNGGGATSNETMSAGKDIVAGTYVHNGSNGTMSVGKNVSAETYVRNLGIMDVTGNVTVTGIEGSTDQYNGDIRNVNSTAQMTVGGNVTAAGYVNNDGTMDVSGSMTAGKEIYNDGTMTVGGAMTAETQEVVNFGDMSVGGNMSAVYIWNDGSGTTMTVGHFADPTVEGDTTVVSDMLASRYVHNSSIMSVTGNVTVTGIEGSTDPDNGMVRNVGSTSQMTVGGNVTAAGYVNNDGTMTVGKDFAAKGNSTTGYGFYYKPGSYTNWSNLSIVNQNGGTLSVGGKVSTLDDSGTYHDILNGIESTMSLIGNVAAGNINNYGILTIGDDDHKSNLTLSGTIRNQASRDSDNEVLTTGSVVVAGNATVGSISGGCGSISIGGDVTATSSIGGDSSSDAPSHIEIGGDVLSASGIYGNYGDITVHGNATVTNGIAGQNGHIVIEKNAVVTNGNIFGNGNSTDTKDSVYIKGNATVSGDIAGQSGKITIDGDATAANIYGRTPTNDGVHIKGNAKATNNVYGDSGGIMIDGTLQVDHDLHSNTGTSSRPISVVGNTTVDGSVYGDSGALTIGDADHASDLTVGEDFIGNGSTINVAGDMSVARDLLTSGASINVKGDLDVDGNVNYQASNSNMTFGGGSITVGDETHVSDLTVDGDLLTNSTNISVSGDMTIDGNFNVVNDTNRSGGGTSTVTVGNSSNAGSLSIAGDALGNGVTFNVIGDMFIGGNYNYHDGYGTGGGSPINVGDENHASSLTVGGDFLTNSVNATVIGDMSIGGNINYIASNGTQGGSGAITVGDANHASDLTVDGDIIGNSVVYNVKGDMGVGGDILTNGACFIVVGDMTVDGNINYQTATGNSGSGGGQITVGNVDKASDLTVGGDLNVSGASINVSQDVTANNVDGKGSLVVGRNLLVQKDEDGNGGNLATNSGYLQVLGNATVEGNITRGENKSGSVNIGDDSHTSNLTVGGDVYRDSAYTKVTGDFSAKNVINDSDTGRSSYFGVDGKTTVDSFTNKGESSYVSIGEIETNANASGVRGNIVNEKSTSDDETIHNRMIINGNVLAGDLDNQDIMQITGTVTVNNITNGAEDNTDASLTIGGNTTVSNDVTNYGNMWVKSNLAVGNAVNNSGDLTVDGNMSAKDVNNSGNLTVNENAGLSVDGDATIGNDFANSGDKIQIAGDLSVVGTITNGLTTNTTTELDVTGDVSGANYTKAAQALAEI